MPALELYDGLDVAEVRDHDARLADAVLAGLDLPPAGRAVVAVPDADGHALELDDDAFDVAVSVNGVSLFPDMALGLAELVRVTRPGGRVVIVAFGPIQTVEFITFFTSAVQAAVPGVTPLPTNPPVFKPLTSLI